MADAEPPADRKKGRRLLGAARNLTAAMSQNCLVVEWLRCLCWWTAQPKHCETLIIIIITEVSLGWRSKWSPPSACSQVALDRAARTSLINSPATVNLARAGPRAHCDNKDKLLLGLLELSFLLCFAPRYGVNTLIQSKHSKRQIRNTLIHKHSVSGH